MNDANAIRSSAWQSIATHAAIPGDVVEIRRVDAPATSDPLAVGRVIRFDEVRQAPRGEGRRCVNWTLFIDLMLVGPDAVHEGLTVWQSFGVRTDDGSFCLRRDSRHGSSTRSLSSGSSYLRDILIEAAGEDPLSAIAHLVHPGNTNDAPLGFAAAARILERHDPPREWMIRYLQNGGRPPAGVVVPFRSSRDR